MAERSIIDTIARAIYEDDPPDGLGWSDASGEARKYCRSMARAALRSLIDAGPTEAMVDAGLKVTCGGLDDEANRYWQAEEFNAMLRAALEQADNV